MFKQSFDPSGASSQSSSMLSKLTSSSTSSSMITSDNIRGQITWILTNISYHTLTIRLKLEKRFSATGSKSSYTERLEFFTEIINMACKTAYNTSIVCAVHTVIVIIEEIKKEMLREIDLPELITQYKLLNQYN